ncbi:MAG: PilZ domain-containing protein [Xanthobacteraceae bacterium]|nr:PilZ domain-containing protein [Xanthobacteraceae bacterium]
MRKDFRKALRAELGSKAWIRLDDGFSVRACWLIDLSNSGVCILVAAPHDVADRFSLLLSRNAALGRRCQVKWRKGSEIGAEFVGAKG